MTKYKIRLQIYNILVKLVSFTQQRFEKVILKLIEMKAIEVGIDINSKIYKIGVATLKAESNLNPNAICHNKDWRRYSDGTQRSSIDYGIAQLNDYWYMDKEKIITKKDAMNPQKALKVFWTYFPKRKNDWYGYRHKGYLKFL